MALYTASTGTHLANSNLTHLACPALLCSLPIVKTKKALADMTSGQVLRVISTNPGSVRDMTAFAEQTGNDLLEKLALHYDGQFSLAKVDAA